MKIFITGATGYIGHSLSIKLAELGNTVHALVRNPQSAYIPQHPNIHLFTGDIGDRSSIARAIKGCEQVFHVAGFTKLWARDKKLFYEINVNGTKNVLDEAYENGVKKLVYTSSCAVFGPSYKDPLCEKDPRIISFGNDYDLSKYICECLVKEYAHRGLFAIIVNPSKVYGPGIITHSNPITQIIMRCLKKQFVFLPDYKDVLANYAFIDDVVSGHLSAMQRGTSGERYILGGENFSYNAVFSILKEEIEDAKLVKISSALMKGIGWIELIKNKLTGIEPAFTPSIIGRFTKNAAFSSKKAINQLDYCITPFRVGIHHTITNLKKINHV